MGIRRTLAVTAAAGALLLSACATSDDEPSAEEDTTPASSGGAAGAAGDMRIDVITHAAPGDSFWDVVKGGAEQAGSDLGVDLQYQSDPDAGAQSTLIDNAVADGTGGLVISMANPDGLQASIAKAVAAGIPATTTHPGIHDQP